MRNTKLNNLSPILLFVYNRPAHTRETIKALKNNTLAKDSCLIIHSDGARNKDDVKQVEEVRQIISTVDGFKSVKIVEQTVNLGLAKSIITQVTAVINQNGKVIVLEDDIVTSSNFLTYMNNALEKYHSNSRVWHVSGWNYPIEKDGLEDAFFWQVMNCWGWATWSDRWEYFEKEPAKLKNTWDKNKIRRFNLNGVGDFWSQVLDNLYRRRNTWAVFWYATIFDNNGLCLNPTISLVQNIGRDGSGENCSTVDNEMNVLQKSPGEEISLPNVVFENTEATLKVEKHMKSLKLSLYVRFLNKIKRAFL